MALFSAILSFLLGITYLISGFVAAYDWVDFALGILWSMMGGMDFYRWRRAKRIEKSLWTEDCKHKYVRPEDSDDIIIN